MSTWYSTDLGDGVEAQAPTLQIQQAYTALEIATTLPASCAVFSYYDRERNIVTAYFSPTASELAMAFGAIPCARPEKREGFVLSIGSMHAWDLLFETPGR